MFHGWETPRLQETSLQTGRFFAGAPGRIRTFDLALRRRKIGANQFQPERDRNGGYAGILPNRQVHGACVTSAFLDARWT